MRTFQYEARVTPAMEMAEGDPRPVLPVGGERDGKSKADVQAQVEKALERKGWRLVPNTLKVWLKQEGTR